MVDHQDKQFMLNEVSDTPTPTDECYDSLKHAEPNIVFHWLDAVNQHDQVYHIYCVDNHSSSDLMFPAPYSYNTMLTGGVDLLWSASNQIFPVIFDPSASKA